MVAEVSSVRNEGGMNGIGNPARIENMVEIQSKLPLVKIGASDKPTGLSQSLAIKYTYNCK